MTSTITFTDKASFETALNALALHSTPPYESCASDLTITSQDNDAIVDALALAGVEGFKTKHINTSSSEQAGIYDPSFYALACASFGENGDYGHYGQL